MHDPRSEDLDPLLHCLLMVCQQHHRPLSAEAALNGLPLQEGMLSPSVFARAAKRAGLTSKIVRSTLRRVNPHLLPAIALLADQAACVIHTIDWQAQTVTVSFPDLPDAPVTQPMAEFNAIYRGELIYLRPEFQFDASTTPPKATSNQHWFWGVMAENRKLYRDVLIAAAVINVLALAMPLYVMNVYDRVVPNYATETLWVLSAGVMIALLLDLTLRLVRHWFVDLAATRADVKLSSAIMEQVLGSKLVDRPASAGAFASQIQGFEAIRHFMASATVVGLVDLPFVLLFAGIVWLIGPSLAIPIVVGALLVLLYALLTQAKLHALSESVMRSTAMRNATLIEGLANLDHVKSFGLESRVQSIWEQTSVFVSRVAAQMRFRSASVASVATWLQHMVGVSVMMIGVYLIIDHQLSLGGLIAAYLLAARAMAPISQTAGLIAQYHHASTALEALNHVMDQPVERPAHRHWVARPAIQGEITFRHVRFRYPNEERYALDDVSFQIKAGERVAILGRNGSGKSTIEKLILQLYEPESGVVMVDGVDSRQIDPSELRRQIGYVPQEISLFAGTLRENLTMAHPKATAEAIHRAAQWSGVSAWVDSHPLGYELPVGERGQFLSGGQKQTVAIARALIHNPRLLLLDEPTGALDHSTEAQIKDQFTQRLQDQTLILVTHRSALLSWVDRIIVIDRGRIVADGPKAEVLEALRQGRIAGAQ